MKYEMPPECRLLMLIYKSSKDVEPGTKIHKMLTDIESAYPDECSRLAKFWEGQEE